LILGVTIIDSRKLNPIESFLRTYQYFDKETYMSTVELIENNGYDAETHFATTKDGYILQLHRIPRGHRESSTGPGEKSNIGDRAPVLLINYIPYASSSCWVHNLRNQSLGYILADAGFDVWLGNYRGTGMYAMNHTTLDVNSAEFWRFASDEWADDVGEMIDFVRKESGHEKIFMISAVMSSTPPLLLLAGKPEYNDKLSAAVVFSPFIGMRDGIIPWGIKSLYKVLAPRLMESLRNLKVGELKMTFNYFMQISGPLIGNMFVELDKRIRVIPWVTGAVTLGHPANTIDITRLSLYYGQLSAVFSSQAILQLFQIVGAGHPAKFDWGEEENLRRYGQVTPPSYDLSQISVPTMVAYSRYDVITNTGEAHKLASKIQHPTLYEIPHDDWTHFHVIYGTNTINVFSDVINYMKQHL
jgi:pimeloyl-ACP methyl ester carboxylesterase